MAHCPQDLARVRLAVVFALHAGRTFAEMWGGSAEACEAAYTAYYPTDPVGTVKSFSAECGVYCRAALHSHDEYSRRRIQ